MHAGLPSVLPRRRFSPHGHSLRLPWSSSLLSFCCPLLHFSLCGFSPAGPLGRGAHACGQGCCWWVCRVLAHPHHALSHTPPRLVLLQSQAALAVSAASWFLLSSFSLVWLPRWVSPFWHLRRHRSGSTWPLWAPVPVLWCGSLLCGPPPGVWVRLGT